MANWWDAAPLAPEAPSAPPAEVTRTEFAPENWWAAATPAPQQTPYRGAILPFAKDAQGNTSLAWPEILRSAGSALTAPGDAYTGKLPPLVNGQYNPEMINRATNLAALISPPSPASIVDRPMVPHGLTPPTAEELKAAGGAGYDAARQSGLEIAPNVAVDAATRITNDLASKGMGADVAPTTHKLLDNWVNPPSAAADAASGIVNRVVTPSDLQALRQNLSKISGQNLTDQTAGRAAAREIDGILEALTPGDVVAGPSTPEGLAALADVQRNARQNYAAGMRANDITGDLSRANVGMLDQAEAQAQAANSGLNFGNILRQKIKEFLKNPDNIGGYTDAELQALRDVLKGSFTQNALRQVGNRLGAGGGVMQSGLAGLGGAVGYNMGGPAGAAVGMAAPVAVGTSARMLGNKLAENSLLGIESMLRERSPMYADMLAQQLYNRPDMGRDAMLMKLLLPSLFNQAPMSLAPPIPKATPGFI